MSNQLALLAQPGDPDAELKLSIRQKRAHAWFSKEFNLRPELSTHPAYRFTDKDTGEVVVWLISAIELKYVQYKKEEARIRAAERRREKRDLEEEFGGWG